MLPLILCVILWGLSTFLNRLSANTMPPILMQVIVGAVFIIYIPIALKLEGINNPLTYKWSAQSIILTCIATVCSIVANILLYLYLKNNAKSMAPVTVIALYPLFTLLLSIIFLQEHITYTKFIGICVMILGIILLSL